jgi:Ca2+-binding EF-hand superfamily protein
VEELFKEYDVDGSGSIDITELRRMVKGHLYKPCTCQTYLIEISTFPHGFNSGVSMVFIIINRIRLCT